MKTAAKSGAKKTGKTAAAKPGDAAGTSNAAGAKPGRAAATSKNATAKGRAGQASKAAPAKRVGAARASKSAHASDPAERAPLRIEDLKPLPRSFYDRDTVRVAHDLLGKLLVHKVDGIARVGRIVEVEAYLGPGDLAAHTSRGLTPRTRAMFGPPGHIYVYLVYGMHHCMNIVTEPDGTGTAVLLRALEPVANLEVNTRGPGRLCKALGIDLSHYGADLITDALFVAEDPDPPSPISIVSRPRVGVDYAGPWAEKLLRFYIEGNRYVSKK